MDKALITRSVTLSVTWLNLALVGAGWDVLPWSDEQVGVAVSGVLTFAASAWTYWKNNSHTSEAKLADEYLVELKS